MDTIFITFVIFLIPIIEKPAQIDAYRCQFIRDLIVKEITNSKCPAFDCWDAQLRDTSRMAVVDILNTFKSLIANGTCQNCYNKRSTANLYEMNYHWYLELAAMKYSAESARGRCSFRDNFIFDHIDPHVVEVSPDYYTGSFNSSLYTNPPISKYEYYEFTFPVDEKDEQEEAITKLRDMFFVDEPEGLHYNAIYSYGTASLFGCSLQIRNTTEDTVRLRKSVNTGRTAFLYCIFASRKKISNTIVKPSFAACVQHDEVSQFNVSTGLCYYQRSDREAIEDTPCQIYYDTVDYNFTRPCEEEIPSIWAHAHTVGGTDYYVEVLFPRNSKIENLILSIGPRLNTSITSSPNPAMTRQIETELYLPETKEPCNYSGMDYVFNCVSPIILYLIGCVFFLIILAILVRTYR